jgi:hypothetical protein
MNRYQILLFTSQDLYDREPPKPAFVPQYGGTKRWGTSTIPIQGISRTSSIIQDYIQNDRVRTRMLAEILSRRPYGSLSNSSPALSRAL